jgi:hypothetical protein
MRKNVLIIVVSLVVVVGIVTWIQIRRHPGANAVATTTTTSTTTTVSIPNAPLTGLPDPGGSALTRSALTVKIENTPEALPQWGVEDADVVYEEIVNGGITRLAAIFNSRAPVKVGPVRSVRPTDTQVVWPIGGIFAYSGGAPYAVASIETVPSLKLVNETSAGTAMFRDLDLQAPHNLFANAAALFALGGTPTPPPSMFTYRTPTQKATGRTITNFIVHFPSIYPVTWTWDTTTTSWDRTLFGMPDVTGSGVRESPKNVIVMYVNYVNGIGSFTSYADLQGTGKVDVFSDGREVAGTWSRGSSKSDLLTYQTANGQPIALTPGQTWVELLNVGAALTLNATP